VPRIRRSLLVFENSTNHCTWRGHGLSRVLECDDAREKLLELIRKYKEKFGVQVLSYCLMGTHPHVMCRATMGQEAFSEFWKRVNWSFAYWYNRRTTGRGQVVMERMLSPCIQDGRHQLEVMRYGDLNPVRASLVGSPAHWRWSSHRHYAYGEENDLITDAPEYLALATTGPERRQAYLHLFARPLPEQTAEKRDDLVFGPFVGDPIWVAREMTARGLSPPG
jgi:putative transposase